MNVNISFLTAIHVHTKVEGSFAEILDLEAASHEFHELKDGLVFSTVHTNVVHVYRDI